MKKTTKVYLFWGTNASTQAFQTYPNKNIRIRNNSERQFLIYGISGKFMDIVYSKTHDIMPVQASIFQITTFCGISFTL